MSGKQINEHLHKDIDDHQQLERRRADAASSFYDKLAALSAGSIAIAASLCVGVLTKSELVWWWRNAIVNWLFYIVLLLLVSLLSAISHNLILVKLAELDAAYSLSNILLKVAELTDRLTMPPKAGTKDRQNLVNSDLQIGQDKTIEKIRRRSQYLRIAAVISISSFIIAYILIATAMWNIRSVTKLISR